MAFESVSAKAKRAQYKVTQRPIAYSVNGGVHNASGKTICLRWRVEIAEQLGWKLGDCVEIETDPDQPGVVRVTKSKTRGYKLFCSSKRNGISCYWVRLRWQDTLGFPNVFTQVGCDIIEMIDGGVIFRIRTEDDVEPSDSESYKEPTKVDDDAFGFAPRTLTHRFSDTPSMADIRQRIDIDAKLKRLEELEARSEKLKEIFKGWARSPRHKRRSQDRIASETEQ